jgi:hypothetical protein
MLFPLEPQGIRGAIRASRRLHWTRAAARAEADAWTAELSLGPIAWHAIDGQDDILIGYCGRYEAVVRSVLLPEGPPPIPADEAERRVPRRRGPGTRTPD